MIQALESVKCFITLLSRTQKLIMQPTNDPKGHLPGTHREREMESEVPVITKLGREAQKARYLGIAMGNKIGPIKSFPLFVPNS